MTEIWTPEDDLRRYFPELGLRLAQLPLMEIAQYALEMERELRDGEKLMLSVERGQRRSEGSLTIVFPHDREISYMLVKPFGGMGDWRPIGFRPG